MLLFFSFLIGKQIRIYIDDIYTLQSFFLSLAVFFIEI